jgi:ATP-dependent DNA helicase DinG
LLQAGCGVGKTRGFLIPAIRAIAAAKRILIATPTTQLVRQMMASKDLEAAKLIYTSVTGKSLRYAARLGLKQFLSPSRAAAAGAMVVADDTIESILERYPNLQQSGICLMPSSLAEEKAEYRAQANDVQDADLLITTHAALALDRLTGGSLLDIDSFDAIIVDEADKLPDAAAGLLDTALSVAAIRSAELCATAFKKCLKSRDPGHMELALTALIDEARQESVQTADIVLRDAQREVMGSARKIMAAIKHPSEYATLTWSDDLVALKHRNPARLLRNVFHQRTTILTSGTLAVRDKDAGFSSFRYELGLSEDIHPVSSRIEPKVHGTLQFVLASRSLPTPRLGEPLRDTWLAYCARAIQEAQKDGEAVLVLTTNYADTAVLGGKLIELGVPTLVHTRSTRLQDLMRRRAHNEVLVTPAGWEGVDAPYKWKHLVIPRVPYPMVDDDNEYSFLNSTEIAMRRLRQAMGRVMREPEDSATVWLLDSRFPLPRELISTGQHTQQQASRHLRLVESIPERFRKAGIRKSSFSQAQIADLG